MKSWVGRTLHPECVLGRRGQSAAAQKAKTPTIPDPLKPKCALFRARTAQEGRSWLEVESHSYLYASPFNQAFSERVPIPRVRCQSSSRLTVWPASRSNTLSSLCAIKEGQRHFLKEGWLWRACARQFGVSSTSDSDGTSAGCCPQPFSPSLSFGIVVS